MNQPLPKVSVVCAWYNRADYIRDTIDSVLAQDYPNFDLTVVNDGSPDPRVREILDSYDDPRLRVIHQENTGFTRAICRAIDESDGACIAIQGAGDLSLPGRLSAQVAYLEEQRDVVAVGTSCAVSVPGKGVGAIEKADTVVTDDLLRRKVPFTHGSIIYRRSAYVEAGGYCSFFKFSQDWDFYRRLIKCGEVRGLPAAFYKKFLFDDGASVSPSKKIQQYCYANIANGSSTKDKYFFEDSGSVYLVIPRWEIAILSIKVIASSLISGRFGITIIWINHFLLIPVRKNKFVC